MIVEPFAALLPAVGVCERTSPSRPGSVTSCVWTRTLKPALWRVEVAESWSWPVTSGTVELGGPFETLRMIVEFGAAEPLGSCATT